MPRIRAIPRKLTLNDRRPAKPAQSPCQCFNRRQRVAGNINRPDCSSPSFSPSNAANAVRKGNKRQSDMHPDEPSVLRITLPAQLATATVRSTEKRSISTAKCLLTFADIDVEPPCAAWLRLPHHGIVCKHLLAISRPFRRPNAFVSENACEISKAAERSAPYSVRRTVICISGSVRQSGFSHRRCRNVAKRKPRTDRLAPSKSLYVACSRHRRCDVIHTRGFLLPVFEKELQGPEDRPSGSLIWQYCGVTVDGV